MTSAMTPDKLQVRSMAPAIRLGRRLDGELPKTRAVVPPHGQHAQFPAAAPRQEGTRRDAASTNAREGKRKCRRARQTAQ
jgi:hypothetical protein